MTLASPELLAEWEKIRETEDPTLEALALLRRLESEAHQSRNRTLQNLARSFLGLEIPLPLPSLPDLLSRADQLPAWVPPIAPVEPWTTRLLLARSDRAWEKRLIESGLARGWKVEGVEYTFPLPEISAHHQRLEWELWPAGIILRVESVALSGEEQVPAGQWKGRWWLLLRLAKSLPLG